MSALRLLLSIDRTRIGDDVSLGQIGDRPREPGDLVQPSRRDESSAGGVIERGLGVLVNRSSAFEGA